MKKPDAGAGGSLGWIKKKVRTHLIEPFKSSHAPVWHIARGATIGMFVALTPTVGVQMYITGAIWVICRYIFRYRFNLPIAIAMVWITNPVTTLPIYFGYLLLGQYLLEYWGHPPLSMTYEMFVEQVNTISAAAGGNAITHFLAGLYVLLVEFGWPMLLGSLVVAIPTTIATYPCTWSLMTRYRHRLARQAGMDYDSWNRQFVKLD